MLKMLATQLTGVFSKVREKEEDSIEDAARMLAQARVGEGTIYIKGFEEMRGVESEVAHGLERFDGACVLTDPAGLTPADRVVIFSRFSGHGGALHLGRDLASRDIPFVAVASSQEEKEDDLSAAADVFINLSLTRPLLPAVDGSRTIYPSLIGALYVYHSLKFNVDEIVAEND